MRRFLIAALLVICIPQKAFAFGAVVCGLDNKTSLVHCVISYDDSTVQEAQIEASQLCSQAARSCVSRLYYSNECVAVAVRKGEPVSFVKASRFLRLAETQAMQACTADHQWCYVLLSGCDGNAVSQADISAPFSFLHSLKFPELFAPISFGVVGILVLLVSARRAAISNYIIHGNLPYKLSNYGDDIEVLFTRTQRVNWYGRVIFGIVARLGMTDHQLLLVRRYWLGRVIAFDSLRRQRQNQLAAVHLQLAARVKADAKDGKPLSQIWAVIKTIFLMVFYLLRALFSFLFGFLFIRVTIAKLVRGKLIESKDLVLILQAKEAIEQSATYLKEYLTTAETFNGEEELFEPARPIDATLTPLHGRGQAKP